MKRELQTLKRQLEELEGPTDDGCQPEPLPLEEKEALADAFDVEPFAESNDDNADVLKELHEKHSGDWYCEDV